MNTQQRGGGKVPKYRQVTKEERFIKCKKCGAEDISKNGKENGIQYFRCKVCDARFNEKDTYPRGRYNKLVVDEALNYYYAGMSIRAIRDTFENFGYGRMSTSTIWKWIVKYTKMVITFTESLRPNVG